MTIPAEAKPSRRKVVMGIMLVGVLMLVVVGGVSLRRPWSNKGWNVSVAWTQKWRWYSNSKPMHRLDPDGFVTEIWTLTQFGPLHVVRLRTPVRPSNKTHTTNSFRRVIKEEPGSDPEATSGSQDVVGEAREAAGASEASE